MWVAIEPAGNLDQKAVGPMGSHTVGSMGRVEERKLPFGGLCCKPHCGDYINGRMRICDGGWIQRISYGGEMKWNNVL